VEKTFFCLPTFPIYSAFSPPSNLISPTFQAPFFESAFLWGPKPAGVPRLAALECEKMRKSRQLQMHRYSDSERDGTLSPSRSISGSVWVRVPLELEKGQSQLRYICNCGVRIPRKKSSWKSE